MRLILSGVASLVLGAACLMGTHTNVYAAGPATTSSTQKKSNVKIADDLEQILRDAAADEIVTVIVIMKEQVLREELDFIARNFNNAERRELVVTRLKEVATQSQVQILNYLEDQNLDGNVQFINPLWIRNDIVVHATPIVIRELANRDDVGFIQLDHQIGEEVFPVEPPQFDNAGGNATAGNIECGVEVMGAPQVWSDLGITGEGVVVGIIDTGCCITHPDLVNQIWVNEGEIPGNGIDDDGNDHIDDINGWNFRDDTNNISDKNGHGTHTAGTVCGDGTNGTTTGMAPDVSMMILKFWNNFGGESVVWDCHQYGVANGADVLTASIGWPHSQNPDRVEWRNVCLNSIAAGVIVNYAAGNEGSCCGMDSTRTPGDVPEIITCGATDCNDNIASFSSRGPVTWENIPPWNDCPTSEGGCIKPTISAPGVNTVSTSSNCSGYTTLSGTSMATPHVAGAIALMLDANPALTPEEVKEILMETSIDLGIDGRDNTFGSGRVDAYAAVLEAQSRSSAELTGVQVVTGLLLDGGLPEILESDDAWLHAQSGFGVTLVDLHSMEIRVTAITSIDSPSNLEISIESRIDEPSGLAQIRMRNWNTNNLDLVGSFPIGNADQVGVVGGVSASNYVDGAGNIEMSMKHLVFVPFLAFDFESFVDQVVIGIN